MSSTKTYHILRFEPDFAPPRQEIKDLFSNTGCTIKITTGNCGNIINFFLFSSFGSKRHNQRWKKMIASEALEVSA